MPEYDGNSNPKAYVRAFMLAISQAYLNDEEKDLGYCGLFRENLCGPALKWFIVLEENYIENFTQLMLAFLKQYYILMGAKLLEANLWNLTQGPKEPLRSYITKFKEIKARIRDVNDEVAPAALKTDSSSRKKSGKNS